MNRKTRVLLIVGFFGVLTGCSKGMDGTYQGYERNDMGNPELYRRIGEEHIPRIPTPLWLTVSGEKGVFKSPGQKLSFPARVEGDRLILTDKRGGNPLVFVRQKDDKTLDCPQCAQNGMPDMWIPSPDPDMLVPTEK